MIGRDTTLALLEELFATARNGNPIVAMVSGPPGIGKSRLLDEFPGPRFESVIVLRGGSSEAAGMPPYLPFIEALGDYFAAVDPARLHEILGTAERALIPIFPDLAGRIDITQLPALEPEQQRFRLFEAVVHALTAIARETPLILQLDDLHWADPATLDLLVHIAGRARQAPLLIVGSYRDGERGPDLSAALTELNRTRRLVTIPLEPLDEAGSRQLLASHLQGEVAPELSETLGRLAEGNPFFLEEQVRALADAGTLTFTNDAWALAGNLTEHVPPRIAEAIRGRLDRLGPEVVATLQFAAVAGRSFQPGFVATAARMSIDTFEAHILLAQRAQLVQPALDGRMIFTHDLIRETLLLDLGTGRRRALHLAIAEALEAEPPGDCARGLADLTFHFVSAADTERGAGYSLESARRSMQQSAPRTAMEHYRSALRLAPGNEHAADRIEALTGLGAAATQAGIFTQAIGAYRRVCDEAMRSGDTETAARAWTELGRVYWRQESITRARQAFRRAIELYGADDSAARAETLLLLANLEATSFGRTQEAIGLVDQAQEIVERIADRRLTARALMTLGNVRARHGDAPAGRTELERALVIGQELDDPSLIAEIAGHLSTVAGWMGDFDVSRQLSELRADQALRAHDVFELRHAYGWIAMQYLIQGYWSAAWQAFEQQSLYVDAVQSAEPLATLCTYRARYHYIRGEWDESVAQIERAIELLDNSASSLRVWIVGVGVLVTSEADDDDRALALLAELDRAVEGVDRGTPLQIYALAHRVLGFARLGRRSDAARDYRELLPHRGTLAPGPIDRALGLAAWAGGNPEAAHEHFSDAAAHARRTNLRPELVLALLNHAALASEHPGSVDAAALKAEGLQLAESLEMDEMAQRALRPLPARQRQPIERPAGLTAREIEVIRLISEGLTNRQIADQLFISEKTAARHLTNIYAKTGVDNRAGATAFALRAGLA